MAEGYTCSFTGTKYLIMVTLLSPLWLLLLLLIPVIRWLHRFQQQSGIIPSSTLFLWQNIHQKDNKGSVPGKPDPRWLFRALIAGLIILSLAQPALVNKSTQSIDIWLDDSLSMFTIENKQSRMDNAVQQLEPYLQQHQTEKILIHSLGNPALTLKFDSTKAGQLKQWAKQPRGEPQPPPPTFMGADHKHILLTDGADSRLNQWAQKAPLQQLIQSGNSDQNIVLSHLSLRNTLLPSEQIKGLVHIDNLSDGVSTALLSLHYNKQLIKKQKITISATDKLIVPFSINKTPGELIAKITAADDKLLLDNELHLNTEQWLRPVYYHLSGQCSPYITALLNSRSSLVQSKNKADIIIDCSGNNSPSALPAIIFHPPKNLQRTSQTAHQHSAFITKPFTLAAGLPYSDLAPALTSHNIPLLSADKRILISKQKSNPAVIDCYIDSNNSDFSRQTEFPLLIFAMIDQLTEYKQSNTPLRSSRNLSASQIKTLPLAKPLAKVSTTSEQEQHTTSISTDFTNSLLIIILLLLLVDIWLSFRLAKQQPYTILPAYALVLIMLLLALWNIKTPLDTGTLDLLLLLDESNSIPEQHNDKIWQNFLKQSHSLPGNSRISLIRFADRAATEIPWTDSRQLLLEKYQQLPRHRFVDKGASAINSALKYAINTTSTKRNTAIILATDGIDTESDKQAVFPFTNKNPLLSLYYLAADNQYNNYPFYIESINIPPAITADHSLAISIAIKANKETQGSLQIIINNKPVAYYNLHLQPEELRVIYNKHFSDKAYRQTIEIIARDQQGNKIARKKQIITYQNSKNLLYISQNSIPEQIQQLKNNGWQIIHKKTHELLTDKAQFNTMDIIILDNIQASEISPYITKNMLTAVHKNGTGLIVLGGPDSFGSGGYRHSDLEQALPVISEAARPLPAAAFVFLVDKSGSMDTLNNNNSRLADAFRAVTETAKSLRPGDETALIVFDKSVEVLLPLKKRADNTSALDQRWQLKASGGTRLAPALTQAVKVLEKSQAEQRFLILVTDGFVDADKISTLTAMLKQSSIQIIALAIGHNADISSLKKLIGTNNGRLLKVNQSAQLPYLMRTQIEARQSSWQSHSTIPQSTQTAPFLSTQSGKQSNIWQFIHGYQLSRAKSSARIYAATEKGDPLLAIHHYGSGRSAALPGGILKTKSGEPLLAQLILWLNSHQQDPTLNIKHYYQQKKIALTIDTTDTDNHWLDTTAAEIVITYPDGMSHSQSLIADAPGRLTTIIEAPMSGFYTATITITAQQTNYNIYRSNNQETSYHTIPTWFNHALINKKFNHWQQSSIKELLASSSTYSTNRVIYLLLSLFVFFTLIILQGTKILYGVKKLYSSFS